MRKPQEFCVYPLRSGEPVPRVMIQSDTRIGWVYLADGRVLLSPPHASGAYFQHLAEAVHVATLDGETLLLFKAQIAATASRRAGGTLVQLDNGGALGALDVGARS